MYNLLVSAAEGFWDSGRAAFPRERFGEYTAETIKTSLPLSDPATLDRLAEFPTLFAYENPVAQEARVGSIRLIRDAARRALRIEFEFNDGIPPVPPEQIESLEWELDIDGWEMNRTHWAVKDVDLMTVLRDAGLVAAEEEVPPEAQVDFDHEAVLEQLEAFETMALSVATGGSVSNAEWSERRDPLTESPFVESQVPRFVRTCSTPHQFFRQSQAWGGYQERRSHIADAFSTARQALVGPPTPAAGPVAAAVADLNSEYVSGQWTEALERVSEDPDGAITLARSFLESVLKHVLDDFGESHSSSDTLPGLFRTVARRLDLAPDQQTEPEFRRLLGGATTVVEATATIRNRLGDAHGRGRTDSAAHSHHAELAVNAAGTVASFILLRWRSSRG